MASNKKSVKFLPDNLQSDKNSKFLSSTFDPLIQTPEIERIDGFIGSKTTPNYDSTKDYYLPEDSSLRTNYSLDPALVFKDSAGSITDVVAFDDIINEISIQGGKVGDIDRLFRTKFYSYDPYIDWDKLINYTQYYWLPNGPDTVIIDAAVDVENEIIGMASYNMPNGYDLSNGMKIKFSLQVTDTTYQDKEYYVEGVGKSIYLILADNLVVNESVALVYNETFDGDLFDAYPFDGNGRLPVTPEYVTINRSSRDLNPWTRYNRWFHGEIIRLAAEINNEASVIYPLDSRAKRPIVEFKPNLQLYNFGVTGIKNIDLLDTVTTNPLVEVDGTVGYYIDGVLLEKGQRVVFNAAQDLSVRGNVYSVYFDTTTNSPTLHLELVHTSSEFESVEVNFGNNNSGTSWNYKVQSDLTYKWEKSQQHTTLNQAPLFDLFDEDLNSYSDKNYYNTDLIGSKIFGYEIGTVYDNVLGFSVKYQNSVGIGSFVFKNYFMTDILATTNSNNVTTTSTTGITYIKINDETGSVPVNLWTTAEDYKIPVVEIQTVNESTSTLTIRSFNRANTISVTALVNDKFRISTVNTSTLTVNFNQPLTVNDTVTLEITSDTKPNSNGFYKTPLSLTNNPLNGPITHMTLSELEDHLKSMVEKNSNFVGNFPGTGNLRDLDDYTKYGTRLIINRNPIAFAQTFLGKKEHNVVDAIRLASDQYNQFKMNLIRVISNIDGSIPAVDALDMALIEMNVSKDSRSPYYRSDMLGYGYDRIIREYTITNVYDIFPIGTEFDITKLSFQSILVYHNNVQLLLDKDYYINSIDQRILIDPDVPLTTGDTIAIHYYHNTLGCFIPATPTKLGLYPAYEPMMYSDTSYVGDPVTFIVGHDGSVIKSYGDFRDAIILEYEKRIYNNIKVKYDSSVFDVTHVVPGAFRTDKYLPSDAIDLLNKDFINWTGAYSIDAVTNNTFNEGNPFTWNYKGEMDIDIPASESSILFSGGYGESLVLIPTATTSSTELNFGTGDFTIEAKIYVYTSNIPGYRCIIGSPVFDGLVFGIGGATGNTLFYVNGLTVHTTNETAIQDNKWYHVALSRHGSMVQIFLDGILVGYSIDDSSLSLSGDNDQTWIGDTAWSANFWGRIKDVRVVKGIALYIDDFSVPTNPLAITQKSNENGFPSAAITNAANTVLLTLQDNQFVDNSDYDHIVFPYPLGGYISPFVSPEGDDRNSSIYLDGSSYLTIPSTSALNFGTGDFTIEAWVYIYTAEIPGVRVIIGSVFNTGGLEFGLGYYNGAEEEFIDPSNVIWHVDVDIQNETWYHAAMVRSGSIIGLFMDGTLVATANKPESMSLCANGSKAIIGSLVESTSAGFGNFWGYMSNLRVVKGIAVYTQDFTPPKYKFTAVQAENENGFPSAAINDPYATVLLVLQDRTLVDNSIYSHTVTPIGNPVISLDNIPFGTAPVKLSGEYVTGYWRGIYKYFYDTDRPHTHPWEILGYSVKPLWWDDYYSWIDLDKRAALISAIINGYTNEPYLDPVVDIDHARPSFSSYIPVDRYGNLLTPTLDTLLGDLDKQSNWKFGDYSPAETAWRRSSYWPFALNALAALLNPTEYTTSMYDTSRTQLNILKQLTYLQDDLYLSPKKLLVEGDVQTSGFGVYVVEKGLQKDSNYINSLKEDLTYLNFNLFHKLGGFASKDKLQILIDSVDPLSQAQGALLPPEDYTLLLNVSNPIVSASISGVILQKYEGKFIIKGYDKFNSYFEILKPILQGTSGALTVGGKSETFTEWNNTVNNSNNGLLEDALTSTESNNSRYYKQGQLLRYNGRFYRVKVGHTAQSTFDTTLFYQLPSLPSKGGATVELSSRFESTVTRVPYGSSYSTVQEVYDVLVGYGARLEQQGFIFDEFNPELNEIMDWRYTAKEFLYWSTQNWADGHLITLSPFADYLKYSFPDSVVDDISNGKYEYSLLKADGKSFPSDKFRLSREDGVCIISTIDTYEGIFFAKLNSVQKEHGMVFNNHTIFNDTIYDIETGYKQRRMKISGFRTKGWNGDLSSPGFVYDKVSITDWKSYHTYLPGDLVRYNSAYYESNQKIRNDATFDFAKWDKLNSKPESNLLPNFDYTINQFEDFYSLDIDNFDSTQQQLAQHLIGYTPRTYLNNIFTNPVSQYKFYQGFIKEKGTKNAIDKLSKAGKFTRNGEISFKEDWAFRVGEYGGFSSYNEIEFVLVEGISTENPYVTKLIDTIPSSSNPLINYVLSSSLLLKPSNYITTSTFNLYNGTYSDTNMELPIAGYVRQDDVTVTAYNKNSLLDIANNSLIQEGNTVWLGFLENGGWTVYRYSKQPAKVAGVYVSSPGADITFTTDINHNLSIGDIISIVRFNVQVDGIYIVKDIPRLDQITVASVLTTITDAALLSYGALFKFEEARYSNSAKLAGIRDVLRVRYDEKIWIDSGEDGKWKVYEKLNNYQKVANSFDTVKQPLGQKLGTAIYASDDDNTVLISSPGTTSTWVFTKNNITGILSKQFEYTLNDSIHTYCTMDTSCEFGYSLTYDYNKGFYITGAPAASSVRGPNSPTGVVTTSSGTGNVRGYTSEGLVKIGSRRTVGTGTNKVILSQASTEAVLLNPYPTNNSRFGHSVYVASKASTSTVLLVGTPGPSNTTGKVYAYFIDNNLSISISAHSHGITLSPHGSLSNGSQFGYKISGDKVGNIFAVSAPYHVINTSTIGVVQLFNKDLDWIQTISSPFGTSAVFGEEVTVSPDGTFIFISSVNSKSPDESYGKVAVYKFNGTIATLYQIIGNPVNSYNLKFGFTISISEDNKILAISSLGINNANISRFDFDQKSGETTFDGGTTQFIDTIPDSGVVYIYNNLEGYFIPADELSDSSILTSSKYGSSIAVTNDRILIGAPSTAISGDDDSTVYQFDKIDKTINSWNLSREQEDLVDISTIKKISTIDLQTEEVIDYLEIIDPVKGKIAGIAEQELKYRSAFDPAVYSIGLANNIVDSTTSWIDDHVGELWWDLSTVKYMWYEQGDDLFRKNNWSRTFPGSTIDVYEWVKSDLMPSEWAAKADSNDGLTKGISGQPKYPANSSISVKQVFNKVTNSFENVYYFWVKNKVTVPSVKNRRISSYQVSRLIADPLSNGLKFAEILSADSVAFANIQPSLVGERISVNIAIDRIDNDIPRHTEWLLIAEGDDKASPTPFLEKKLFDSLLGHDFLGNNVPDLSLTSRNRYGIGIRPQQTLFKDRLIALRNIVDFANSVLIKNLILEKYFSFDNLNEKEPIPNILDGEYDEIVSDINSLDSVDTNLLQRAFLECNIENGKIVSVSILNGGFAYMLAPSVTVLADQSGAKLVTTINSDGKVVDVSIENPGSGFTSAPVLVVRPHTVIVSYNADYGGRWTKHAFNYNNDVDNNWTRIKNQTYNTPLYWNKADWASDTFNKFKDYSYVIASASSLSLLYEANVGDYVKINNIGDGYYAILEKISSDKVGNFAPEFDIVYRENGTIQISESLWNYKDSRYSYDVATLDETLYDQIPDLEVFYILTALKKDIFINDLKVNWNLLFFTAVRYALTEQKLLDWTFKTSFIDITNTIGSLDQRPVYKLDNENYFEEYVKEVKPYHSHIRSYKSRYTYLDDQFTASSIDFDMPSFYNTLTQSYEIVTVDNDKINETPWKYWKDNYQYIIGSVRVGNKGVGYTQRPTVTINGGNGSGATAEAYIRAGSIYQILVTDPGSGYTSTPTITISGGGPNVTTSATAVAVFDESPIRKNKIGLRFNRTTSLPSMIVETVSDTFICSGNENKYVLSWLADTDKLNIIPLLDGRLVLSSDYTIEYYAITDSGYTKKYSRFVFLNYVPNRDQEFKITYNKSFNLYNAVDMIEKFHTGTFALSSLMSGIEYPGSVVQGLPFNYSPAWDTVSGYGQYDTDTAWSDIIGDYVATKLIRSITPDSSVLYLDTVDGIVTGSEITILNSSDKRIRDTTVVVSIDEIEKSVTISKPTYDIGYAKSTSTNTGTNITFKTREEFNGAIVIGDRITISGIDDAGFNGIYTVRSVIDTDKFIVTATTVLSTVTSYPSSTATLIISSVLKNVTTGTSLLDNIKETFVTDTSTYFFEILILFKEVSKIEIRKNNEGTFMPIGDPVNGPIPAQEYWWPMENVNGNIIIEFYNLTDPSYYMDIKLYSDPIVEFWKTDYLPTVFYTDATSREISSTFEVNPVDYTIDGDAFLNIQNGYAPEECVAGTVLDTLGINVYTKASNSYAMVYSGSFPISNTVSYNYYTLTMPIDGSAFVTVHFNGSIFDRVADGNSFTGLNQYYMEGNTIYCNIQSVTGRAGYTIITVGGDYSVLDHKMVTATGPSATVESLASINDVRSAYVLVDGQEISEVATSSQYGYMIEQVSPTNKRACVKVYLLPDTGYSHTIQAWFFESEYTKFNRIHEEVFTPGNGENYLAQISNPLIASSLGFGNSPWNVLIINGNNYLDFDLTTDWKIYKNGNYYSIESIDTVTYSPWIVIYPSDPALYFNVVEYITFYLPAPQSVFTMSIAPGTAEPVSEQVIVELGTTTVTRLRPPSTSYYQIQRNQRTFKIDNKHNRDPDSYITDTVFVYANGVMLRSGFEYSFNSANNTITIVDGLLRNGDVVAIVGLIDGEYDFTIEGDTLIFANAIENNNIRVLSFTDHDNMMIRTEEFDGTPLRRFTLSLPALNDNYVWVYVNGVPLTARFDYEILEDSKTIKISNDISVGTGDTVIITTINPLNYGSQILGFRMFEDMSGTLDFHRLSEFYSTTLSESFDDTSTEIHVVDPTGLYSPDPLTNDPGVVLIDGERIEYFRKDGNVLRQLRRSTMGTGATSYSDVGTKVIDQSRLQILPYSSETTLVQTTSTTATTYIISTVTNSIIGDGIVLTSGINAVDQVTVYYGGRQLRKSSLVYHDTSISYDPSDTSLVTLPPEFTINTSTRTLVLNISDTNGINTDITIVQKKGSIWSGTKQVSLINSTATQAIFMREKEAVLPDRYYYGG